MKRQRQCPNYRWLERAIQDKMSRDLPSKYRYVLEHPILFISTRSGEVGSALFAAGSAPEVRGRAQERRAVAAAAAAAAASATPVVVAAEIEGVAGLTITA